MCQYANGDKAWFTFKSRSHIITECHFYRDFYIMEFARAMKTNAVLKLSMCSVFAVLAKLGPLTEYTGEWKHDHRWGWGALTFANGDMYEGEWVDDIMEGSGRYSYKDKSYYQVGLHQPRMQSEPRRKLGPPLFRSPALIFHSFGRVDF